MNANIVAGASIVTGVEEGIYAEVIKSDKFEIEYADPCIKEEEEGFSCIMNETALKEVAKSGDFFCYCAGVASYMLEWYNVGGVKITITKMTLPMKSGLSSSAAICVLVARAFNQIYTKSEHHGGNEYRLLGRTSDILQMWTLGPGLCFWS
jgi:mevalonate kinase